MARSVVTGAHGNGSDSNTRITTPSSTTMTPSNKTVYRSNGQSHSPSKTDRRKRAGGKLRPCLIFLCLLLITSLVISQVLFWTRREELESAVEIALSYAEQKVKYAEHQVERAVAGILVDDDDKSLLFDRHNENRSMQVFGALIQSQTTIVTCYFELKSKYPSENYNRWMKNMLSMQDAMVIFTSPDHVEHMQRLRSHAVNRTVIISIPLEHTPMAQEFPEEFWKAQFAMDLEQERHHGFRLFWIWLSKSWFVSEAIERNYFTSQIYMWSDVGCFRLPRFRGKVLMQHPELIPLHSILQMAHHAPKPPPDKIFNDKKRKHGKYFYHSGSQAIGYAETWREFHLQFQKTVQAFVERGMFLGEDQMVLQSTCLLNPNLCAYVPHTQVTSDNHYFGLRHVLHYGGNYTYWRPPGASVREEQVSSA